MNREVITYGIQFVLLLLSQVLVFNHMDINTYAPYPYVLFILLFPVHINRSLMLFLSFLLGLSVDIFSSSGGVHAAACTVVAYIRPAILKFSFGASYEFHNIKFTETEFGARLTYFTTIIIIHHLILFLLETFNFVFIGYSLKHVLFSTLYTTILSLMILTLFSKRRK